MALLQQTEFFQSVFPIAVLLIGLSFWSIVTINGIFQSKNLLAVVSHAASISTKNSNKMTRRKIWV